MNSPSPARHLDMLSSRSRIVELPLRRNNICRCGYVVNHISAKGFVVCEGEIPVGYQSVYRLDLASIRPGNFTCRNCGVSGPDVLYINAIDLDGKPFTTFLDLFIPDLF